MFQFDEFRKLWDGRLYSRLSTTITRTTTHTHTHTHIKKGEKQMISHRNYKTMTDTDYADDLALLASIPAQVESVLCRLEQAVGAIGLCECK